MTSLTGKFLLLMWKHWVTTKRQWFWRLAELCATILICLLLAFSKTKDITYMKGQIELPYDPANKDTCSHLSDLVAYSPKNDYLEKIVRDSCSFDQKQMMGFSSASELNKRIDKKEFRKKLSVAVLFNDELKNITKTSDLIPNLEITLRLELGQEVLPKLERFNNPEGAFMMVEKSMKTFLVMQTLITRQLIQKGDMFPSDLKIALRRFPTPQYPYEQIFDPQNKNLWVLLTPLCFLLRCVSQVREMVIEKEHQLKESMKIMGLPAWLYLLSWIVYSLVVYFIHITAMTILLLAPITTPFFYFSRGPILFLFLLLIACCAVSFGYLLSTFFSRATKAVVMTIILFWCFIIPYLAIVKSVYTLRLIVVASLLFPSAICYGLYMFGVYEFIGEGIQWYNIWDTPAPTVPYSLGPILIMLIVDTIIYFLLALYIEQVFPGEFGVPQPWYFPFTKSYWTGKPPEKEVIIEESTTSKNKNIEEFKTNLPVGIQIKNLTKIYGVRPVVKNFSLNLYEGHITVLLGHNGAGKTTTMHMITGMIPPSGGTIKVHNYDVRTNLIKARDSMGLCMQHNVFFDELTVTDHLYFVCKLRDLPTREINAEIKKYVKLLGLEGKENARAKQLSGGMQRKLCVGMAMCGKPKVVMLDEPTSSLDPSARRGIWNLLQEQKKDRTILLITHFMDEADLLGDRIAIMANGELECCGSSFFLKKRYGSEYRLILEVTPQCQPNQVTSALRGYISSVRFHSRTPSELIYRIPESESQRFESMLSFLESKMGSLGVESYGISPVSLEEVFLKAGFEANKEEPRREDEEMGMSTKKTSYVRGCSLLGTQFVAMALKHSLCLLRSWPLFLLTQFILPFLIGILIMLNPATLEPLLPLTSSRESPLTMTLDSYHQPITLIETDKNNPYAKSYEKMLQGYQLEKVDSVLNAILETAKTYPSRFRKYHIVGATFKDDFVMAWYNGGYFYSAPLALSLAYNAYVKKKFGAKYSIKYIEYPVKRQQSEAMAELLNIKMTAAEAWTLGILAFIGFYIFFYVRERICKAKHLQFVCGINTFIFWVVPLIIDLLVYHLTVCGLIIITVICNVEEFRAPEELCKLTIVLLSFGYFIFPFIYLLSLIFKQPTKGYILILALGLVTGIIFSYVILLIGFLSSKIMLILEMILLAFPFFPLAKGILYLVLAYSFEKLLCNPDLPFNIENPPDTEIGCTRTELCCRLLSGEFFSLDPDRQGLGVIISFYLGIFCFLLILLIDSGLLHGCAYGRRPNKMYPLEQDVKQEDDTIMNTPRWNLKDLYILVFRNLTKYYTRTPAVNGICLGVKPNECFGLIGENGAGKTTIFKMITNDISMSYGEILIAGLSVAQKRRSAVRLLGYCPQYDALLEELTPRETLRIFALIRGVPLSKCGELGENLAKEFDFFQYLDRKVRELSGGNKRKLSISLALIGEPKILCLDEPTTGIDPSSKRFVWNALTRIRESGIPIILSSHDMDECEALCTRACIIVKGNMKCIGSVQRLKSKFAQGYNLTIKIKKGGSKEAMDKFVKSNFPNVVLKETYEDMVTYHIPDSGIPYSKIFGTIEGSRGRLGIDDYSLGQCTLEQVFLSFIQGEERKRN